MTDIEIQQVSAPLDKTTAPTEAIVLAGGLGTRLRSVVPDLPKCMAMVAGQPFLAFVIDYLRMQGIQKFVFSLGYRHDAIEAFLEKEYPSLQYDVAIENEPLGTGGGLKAALEKTIINDVLVVNGDTLFTVDLAMLYDQHTNKKAWCTLALKMMENFDRYGVVEINKEGCIQMFQEKRFYEKGFINGGVYLLNKASFLQQSFPAVFSFEKEYLEKYVTEGQFYASVQEGYFIDIGIPADYQKAQTDLKKPTLDLTKIDKSWTLFLDRDGVINDEQVGNYILHWNHFIFSTGVLEAWKLLSKKFGTIIIVSNQRGVGKKLMTEVDLATIHQEMQKEVESAGGHIDKIYYCTDVDDKSFYRKPNPGMALLAKKDFAPLDFSKAVMIGNKPSDCRFGRAAGMFTVFLETTTPEMPFPHKDVDLRLPSLLHFAQALQP